MRLKQLTSILLAAIIVLSSFCQNVSLVHASDKLKVGDEVWLSGRYYASSYNSNKSGSVMSGKYVIARISGSHKSIHPYGIRPAGSKSKTISGWASASVLTKVTSSKASTSFRVGDRVTLIGYYYASSYNRIKAGSKRSGIFVIDRISGEKKSINPYGIKPESYKGSGISGWAPGSVLVKVSSDGEQQRPNTGNTIKPSTKSSTNDSGSSNNKNFHPIEATVETLFEMGGSLLGGGLNLLKTAKHNLETRNIFHDNWKLLNILIDEAKENGIFTKDWKGNMAKAYGPILKDIPKQLSSDLRQSLDSGDPDEVYKSLLKLSVKTVLLVNQGLMTTNQAVKVGKAIKVASKSDDVLSALNTNIDDLIGGVSYTQLDDGLGIYADQRGHHPMAKSGFAENRVYDMKKAMTISQDKLDAFGVRHASITGQQHKLYNDFARSGKKLTLTSMKEIEIKAMTNVGVPKDYATNAVNRAVQQLKTWGIEQPTNIPWN